MTETAEQYSLLSSAFEQLPEAMIIADAARRVRFANEAAASLLGFTRERLLEASTEQLRIADVAPSDEWHVVQVRKRSGGKVACELNVRTFERQGETFAVMTFRERASDERYPLRGGEFLIKVIDDFPMAIIVKDVRNMLRHVMVNRAYEEMFGISRDEVVGATDYQLIPKSEAETINRYFEDVIAGKAGARGTVVPITTNRGRMYVRSFETVIPGTDGQPQYVLSLLDNRTDEIMEARRARWERARMRNYLRVADAVLMDLNADGVIVVANEKVADLSGIEQRRLIGMDYRAMPFEGEDAQRWQSVVGCALAGLQPEGAADTFEAALGECHLRWKVLADKHRTRDAIFSVTVVGEDVSEITQRRLEAERANRSKSEFLANMSHELRTPLNAIIGYGEMLQEVAEDDAREEDAGDLHRIIGAAQHLLGLINEVLDMAKIESGRTDVDVEEVDLGTVLDHLRSVGGRLMAVNRNEFVIRGDAGAPLMTDGMKLKQILLNLVANAAKFTKDGHVILDYRIDAQRARFTVTDTGLGIPEEAHERIFDAFTQADGSTTRQFGGTGLGLTICRRLCAALGGTISVRSEPGKGSSFFVDLPQHHGHVLGVPETAPDVVVY
jgi:PAS domain S-box-containing protein